MEYPFNTDEQIIRIVELPCMLKDRRTGETEEVVFYRENNGNLFETLKKILEVFGYDIVALPGRQQREVIVNMQELFAAEDEEEQEEPTTPDEPDIPIVPPEPDKPTEPDGPTDSGNDDDSGDVQIPDKQTILKK